MLACLKVKVKTTGREAAASDFDSITTFHEMLMLNCPVVSSVTLGTWNLGWRQLPQGWDTKPSRGDSAFSLCFQRSVCHTQNQGSSAQNWETSLRNRRCNNSIDYYCALVISLGSIQYLVSYTPLSVFHKASPILFYFIVVTALLRTV